MELPVRVTLLGEKPTGFDSSIFTLEPRQLSLRSATALPLRAPLKIEAADQLWLGEVTAIHPDGAAWIALVRIEHALCELADLRRLAHRFAGKPEHAERPLPAPAVP